MISYGGKITEVPEPRSRASLDRYEGWDEFVFGGEIVTMLKGAHKYSGYDITPFIEKLKQKKAWLQAEYPEEFGPDRWNIDIDKMFMEEEK